MNLDELAKKIENKLNMTNSHSDEKKSVSDNDKANENKSEIKNKVSDAISFLTSKKKQYQPQIDDATQKISTLTQRAKKIVNQKLDDFKNKNKLD